MLKFGSKTLLKKLRNLSISLSLRRGPWRTKLTDGLGLTEAGIKVFEDIHSNEQ
jgi:hypothetical protein